VHGAKGPIFEDGPSFDIAFKLFHGKDGVIPLSEKSDFHRGSAEAAVSLPAFNPLAGRAATISLSTFGPGGPFNFGNFSEKWKKQNNSESSSKKEHSSQVNILFLYFLFSFLFLFHTQTLEKTCLLKEICCVI